MLGVDEHLWRQTRRGGKYVTVIIDLTGIREGTGPARLLDMVSGRSKQAVKQCLAGRDESWREAWRGRRDGRPSPGSRPPPPRSWPDAVAAGDPFHVVRLTGAALDRCRRRVLQDTRGHRGRKGDPWDAARRTLHTGAGVLTDKQRQRLAALFAGDEHVQVEATWGSYQSMIAAYRDPDQSQRSELMHKLIDSISHGVPAALT